MTGIKKILAVLVILSINWSGLNAVGSSVGLFLDGEGTKGSNFIAGTLDLTLASATEFSAAMVDKGIYSIRDIVVQNNGSLNALYTVETSLVSGNEAFCNAINITANQVDDSYSYTHQLSGFKTAAKNLNSSISRTWNFGVSSVGDTNADVTCVFKFIYKGYMINPAAGFNDTEEITNTVTFKATQACQAEGAALPSGLNITSWENHAKDGGTVEGSFVFPNNAPALRLGPTYIKGNLTFGTNNAATIYGPIYVHGNLAIGAGTRITQDASFGDRYATIIVDGTITIADDVIFNGSGTTGAVLLVSKKASGTVIDIADHATGEANVGDAVLYATSGNIHIGTGRTVLDAFITTGLVSSNTGLFAPSLNSNSGWSNPQNAYISDNNRAVANNNSDIVQYGNFNFSVPSGAIIIGIEGWIEGFTTWDRQAQIYLSSDGGLTFTSGSGIKATNLALSWASEDGNQQFSTSSDLWNRTWTSNDFSNSNFKLKLDANSDWGDLNIDQVRLSVFYTFGQTIDAADATITHGTIPTEAICGSSFTPQGQVVINEFVPNPADTTISGDSGEKSPEANGASGVWSNSTGAFADGGTDAYDSGNLKQQYSNFNFNIPSGAVITGIEAKTDAWYTATTPTMTNTGFKSPSANTNSGWSNPDRAYSSNDSRAVSDSGSDIVQYYNFGLSIPTGATINGIEVQIEGYNEGGSTPRQAVIDLSWDGTNYTSGGTGDKTTNMPGSSSGSEAYRTFGGSSDTWNRTWSSEEFTNFRVRLDANTASSGRDLLIDHLQVKVYYTPAAGNCTLGMDLSYDGETSWTPAPTEKSGTPSLTATEATQTFGGSADTWSRSWTASQLSNANFRARVHDTCGTGATAHLDWLRLKAYYTVTGDQGQPAGNNGEWVELYNGSADSVNVDGWKLRDADGGEIIVNSTNSVGNLNIPSKGFLVVYRNGNLNFDLGNASDTLSLYKADNTFIDSHAYNMPAGVPENKSFARIPDGVNNWVDPEVTPGEPNNMFMVPYVEEIEAEKNVDEDVAEADEQNIDTPETESEVENETDVQTEKISVENAIITASTTEETIDGVVGDDAPGGEEAEDQAGEQKSDQEVADAPQITLDELTDKLSLGGTDGTMENETTETADAGSQANGTDLTGEATTQAPETGTGETPTQAETATEQPASEAPAQESPAAVPVVIEQPAITPDSPSADIPVTPAPVAAGDDGD